MQADICLFLMRDGQILSRIASIIFVESPSSLFWLSRFTASKAAIFPDEPHTLERHLVSSVGIPLRNVAKHLGLSHEDLAPFGGPEDKLELNRIEEIASYVFQSNLLPRVIAETTAFRKRLLQHLARCLEASHATSPDTLMLCDLGYNLTAQACLRDILLREKQMSQLHGRYLITLQGALKSLSKTDTSKGYLINFGLPRDTAAVFTRCSGVLDHFCAIAEGTVTDYSDDGTPMCQPSPIDPEQLRQVQQVQQGILDFARAWADNPQKPADHGDPEYISQLLPIFYRMLLNPSPPEIRHFSGWRHDIFSSSSQTLALIDIDKAKNYFLQQGKQEININDLLNMPYDIQPWWFAFTKSLGEDMHRQATAAYGF